MTTGVPVGKGVPVGRGVLAGTGVNVKVGVWVGNGVSVGKGVEVNRGAKVETGVDVKVGNGIRVNDVTTLGVACKRPQARVKLIKHPSSHSFLFNKFWVINLSLGRAMVAFSTSFFVCPV